MNGESHISRKNEYSFVYLILLPYPEVILVKSLNMGVQLNQTQKNLPPD